ncbi:hypothetical protein ACU4GD_18140 [Cupriavidus basilensis]
MITLALAQMVYFPLSQVPFTGGRTACRAIPRQGVPGSDRPGVGPAHVLLRAGDLPVLPSG